MRRSLLFFLVLTACPDDPGTSRGPLVARFVADGALRDCEWGGDEWLGVTQLGLGLEHRLEGPPARDLPAPGTCEDGVPLYAEQAYTQGDPIPDLDGPPRWRGLPGSGALDEVVTGLWYRSVFWSAERCGTLADTIGDGITLESAGSLSGLATPATGTISAITADGVRFTEHDAVVRGDLVELAWQDSGFDAHFIQVRRLLDGDPRQVITCTPDVDGRYTLDDRAWSMVDDGILADELIVAVGFVATNHIEVGDGHAEVLTRVTHTLAP